MEPSNSHIFISWPPAAFNPQNFFIDKFVACSKHGNNVYHVSLGDDIRMKCCSVVSSAACQNYVVTLVDFDSPWRRSIFEQTSQVFVPVFSILCFLAPIISFLPFLTLHSTTSDESHSLEPHSLRSSRVHDITNVFWICSVVFPYPALGCPGPFSSWRRTYTPPPACEARSWRSRVAQKILGR